MNLSRILVATTKQLLQPKLFHSLIGSEPTALVPGGLFDVVVRNKVRCYFPRPNETRRILRHGFWKRMQTRAGRRILMNRILKGRHVYSH